MKILNERSAQMKFARSYDKSNQWGKATVTECKTLYLVTIQIFGYSLPSVLDWKISKKRGCKYVGCSNENSTKSIQERQFIEG